MSRIKNLITQYSEEAVQNALKIPDPSKTGKYLEWILKQQTAKHDSEKIADCISFFHTNRDRLTHKDIFAYKSLSELLAEIEKVGQSHRSIKKQAKENTDKVYESDSVLVVFPRDKTGMNQYGSGTRWCLTSKTAYH